ncbi:BPSL1445 family SYLF domain-containing lipoprotein [Paracandidimonas soli]|uniref:BPSL1445 family SYLF domain-containing lipoprotein n=1 Tax=Paracandidimonas soli TaxID=1917182 RepID=UPI000A909770
MRYETKNSLRPILASLMVAGAALAFTGCTTTPHTASQETAAEQREVIRNGYDRALSRLYAAAPESRELVQKAKGVLIFPSVIGASFIVGGEYGKGELRVNGQHAGYYSTGGGSIGFQGGAQSRATILLFMTQQALDDFRNSQGWTLGVDAKVAVADIGANGRIDTNTAKEPVIGFVLNNVGLAAGISLQGDRIQKIDL